MPGIPQVIANPAKPWMRHLYYLMDYKDRLLITSGYLYHRPHMETVHQKVKSWLVPGGE
jgi:hypothetical protein